MTRRTWRTIEHMSGIGKIHHGEEVFGGVMYSVVIQEEQLHVGDSILPGHKRITGQIHHLESDFLHIPLGETMTLEMEDGRKWDFMAVEGSPLADYKLVNPSGGKGIYE